jgi:hypothetical protein
MDNTGEWQWFAIDVIAVIILGIAIAYGVMMWRRRSRSAVVKEMRDDATRDLYHEDDSGHRIDTPRH